MWVHRISGALILGLCLGLSGGFLHAQVRSSSNYQLQSDSVNIGGGLSSSTNFRQESTVGEVATGRSTSSNYTLLAGYQQMQEVFISMTAPDDVNLAPAIVGITGGVSNGSTSVTVVTDGAAGYQLSIAAASGPAMQSGANSLADYTPAGDPDFTFTTDSDDAHFGFSPRGSDVVQRFLDNGVDTCNTGANNTNFACWDGLSTTATVIAQSSSANQPVGVSTAIDFRVGVGGSATVPPGTYTATTTITALPL